MAVQPLGAGRLEVAVGGEGADARQAHLAAVRVPGHDRVVAVRGELVEHPQVRRVRDRQPDVGGRRSAGPATSSSRSYSRCGSSTPANANVVSPTRSVVRRVGQVAPAGVEERPAQVAPRQLGALGVAPPVVGQEVAQRVAQRRGEVVVGAEHEDAGHVEQRAEDVPQHRHRRRVGQVVAGVDHQVRVAATASPRSHSCLRVWRGVRCRSLRCSTRSDRCPAGSSGSVTRRSVKARVSATAYVVRPAPRECSGAQQAPHVALRPGGDHAARLPQWRA